MDDWGMDNTFDTEPLSSGNQGRRPRTEGSVSGGGWHWVMTLVCLITVSALSFLMAWLTKDTINRPFWMIGAIFTVPTFGLFLAAMLVEQKTCAMTPVTSRKEQYLVALIAVIATFAVGCFCDLLYQHGAMEQVIVNWAQTHPPEKVYSDIVLMVDKSSSLADNGMDAANRKAIKEWLDGVDDRARVGIVVFCNDVIEEIPIDTLAVNRQKIERAMERPTGGYTAFDISMYHVFRMIDNAESGRTSDRATQIIAITDAEAFLPPKAKDYYAGMAKDKNVVFSIVHLGQTVPADNPLMELASSTGGTGTSLGVSELSDYFEGIQNAEEPDWNDYYHELRANGEVDFDLIRVSDPEANLICGVMLGLEGLAIGLCLMLMLSVRGQKRIQPVISVLMSVLAFVLLKIIGPGVGPVEGTSRIDFPQWLLEGIAFSLLGIVFMMKNRRDMIGNMPVNSSGHAAQFGGTDSETVSSGGFDDDF